MEGTMTNSSQSFWLNKYGVFALSLASAFSVNAFAQESTEDISMPIVVYQYKRN